MMMPFWDADWRRTTTAGFPKTGNSSLTIIIVALDGMAVRQE